jgi:DNA-binding transcriptional regulator GbsR (MarR family)
MANPDPSDAGLECPDGRQGAWGHVQKEVCRIFSDLAHLLGSPRSYGEIYGLLFISDRSLAMEEIISSLEISKGTASQGLKVLSEIGAVRRTKESGVRRHSYVAELELKRLISGFLRERFNPSLENGARRLQMLKRSTKNLPPDSRKNADYRLDKLSSWHHHAMQALPFALRLLQDE